MTVIISPGTALLLARAYLVWGDQHYKTALIQAADCVWNMGLLKGPGLCQGISGNAFVFLLLHRMTGDLRYLHRAIKFADFLFSDTFHNGARESDHPVSLFEGWSGAVILCTDILFPNQASFPFNEVFL